MKIQTRIQVVQPVIPHYRVGLFARISSQLATPLILTASGTEPSTNLVSEAVHGCVNDFERATISAPFGLYWQQSLALHGSLRRGDVLVLAGNGRYVSNWPLLARAQIGGIRTVWWSHLFSKGQAFSKTALSFRIASLCDAALVYSDTEADYVRRCIPSMSEKTFSANNTIDTDAVRTTRMNTSVARRVNSIVFTGRLTEKANARLLVEAIALIPSLLRPIVHIVGSGPDLDLLKAATIAAGTADRFIWHGQVHDEATLGEIYATASLFVYPGDVGLSLIHAFAYGLPALVHSSAKYHMPEFAAFEAGKNGQTFERGSAQSLASRLIEMLQNPAELEALGRHALRTVETSYSIQHAAERFLRAVAYASRQAT